MKDVKSLEKDLRAAGATTTEVNDLSQLAGRLSQLHAPKLSAAARQRITARLPIDIDDEPVRRRRISLRWTLMSAASLAVVAIAFGTVVETATPNSPLYGVKQSINGKSQKTQQQKPNRAPTAQPIAGPTAQPITSTYTPPKSTASASPQPTATPITSSSSSTKTTSSSSSSSAGEKAKSIIQSLFFWQ